MTKKQGGGGACLALLLAALTFTGCPADTEPGSGATKVPITWTDVSISGLADGFTGIAYGNEVFVASTRSTGNENSNHVYWSADGETWEEADSGYQALMTNNKKQFTAFLNGGFVIFEGSGGVNNNGKWISSTNGKAWIQARTDAPTGVVGAAYAGGKYIFGGQGGKILAGTTLANVTLVSDQSSTEINWINGLAFGNAKLVATGMKGKILYAAPDDLDAWTDTGMKLFGTNSSDVINQVAFGNGIFIAVGGPSSGTNIGVTSSDGGTWEQTGDLKLTAQNNYTYIGYGAGVFLVGDSNGSASYSTDNGASWTAIADTKFNSGTVAIQGIAYGAGKFVMVGVSGKIAFSVPE
ncbi:MAG: hypothetical protein LBD86_06960 [Spirochaetaceae bacterium]|nr:hypothetical protein [Spirochaetaceae bacterium]